MRSSSMRLETKMARFRPAMGCRLGSTPSPRVLLREAPDRLGRSLPIVRCCLGRGELSNVTERTYVAIDSASFRVRLSAAHGRCWHTTCRDGFAVDDARL